MPDLEKTRNINIPTKTLLQWLPNFCKSSTFLNIKLDKNKTILIFVAHGLISKN